MQDQNIRRARADALLETYEAAARAGELALELETRVAAIAMLDQALRDGGFRRWREILEHADVAPPVRDLLKDDEKLQDALSLAKLDELSKKLTEAYEHLDRLRQRKLDLGLP